VEIRLSSTPRATGTTSEVHAAIASSRALTIPIVVSAAIAFNASDVGAFAFRVSRRYRDETLRRVRCRTPNVARDIDVKRHESRFQQGSRVE
jgi:hypothetical protein